jgi:hypothetical protein
MTDVNTDSYPKPAALPVEKTILDQVQQFQQIDSTQLAQQQAKLNQANQAMGYMTRAMSSLGPDASKEQYFDVGQNAVKMGLVPAAMLNSYVERLNAAKSPRDFYNEFVTAAATHQETINYHLGQTGVYSSGQTDTPVVTSPKPGFGGMRPTGLPIQRQIPPTTPVFDADNQPTLQGPTPAVSPPGVATQPGQRLPIQNQPVQASRPMLPVGKGTGVDVQEPPPNKQVQNRYPLPSGPAVGPPPMFDEGKEAYAKAQLTAGAKAQALKPLIQAIPLMQTPGFLSGPLTDQFTKAVAGLKSTGLINIKDTDDPTAIRQEAVKKLYQYLSNSPAAQRSDSAQTLKEAGSPNPNVQILPALIKLAKDQVALDRIEIAMPNAFKGKDLQNFSKHVSTFPQSVDERAFVLDQDPPEKSKALVDKMLAQRLSKNNRERVEAEKFLRSLDIADEQGFYN